MCESFLCLQFQANNNNSYLLSILQGPVTTLSSSHILTYLLLSGNIDIVSFLNIGKQGQKEFRYISLKSHNQYVMEPEFELGVTLTHSTVNYQRYTQPRKHTRAASLMSLSLVLNGFSFVHVCVLCIKKYAVYDYLLNEHFFYQRLDNKRECDKCFIFV